MPTAMPTLDQVRELPALLTLVVPSDWQDVNGHVNVQYYLRMYDLTSEPLFRLCGRDYRAYGADGFGCFDLENHLWYLAEIHVGDTVTAHLRLLGCGDKRFHGIMFIVNESRGALAAAIEFITTGADLQTRRATQLPDDFRRAMCGLVEQHSRLPWSAPDDQRIPRSIAREEIRNVLANYARGVDRADAALLKSCYHPDATEEHGGVFAGSAMDYVESALPRLRGLAPMQHLLGSSHIELAGNVAWVETYVWTFLRVATARGDMDTITGGRLFDRFEFRDRAWKIAHRRTVFDWNRDTPANEGWVNGMFKPGSPGMLLGAKAPDDPTYRRP